MLEATESRKEHLERSLLLVLLLKMILRCVLCGGKSGAGVSAGVITTGGGRSAGDGGCG